MNKLTFSQLGSARANPAAFKASLATPARFSYSYMQLIQNLILRMHQRNWDRNQAGRALQADLDRHFSAPKRHQEMHGLLDQYCASFNALPHFMAYTRLGVQVDVAGSGQTYLVSGKVPRVDLCDDGLYAAVLFTNGSQDPSSDVRLPFVQIGVAQALGVQTSDVLPGIYDFEAGTHAFAQFTCDELDEVLAEFSGVFAAIQ